MHGCVCVCVCVYVCVYVHFKEFTECYRNGQLRMIKLVDRKLIGR